MMEENSLVEEQVLGPITVNSFGERFFYNLNRNSFSKTSAFALYEAKFGKALFTENVLNVIVGSDSGLLPRYIQSQQLPKGTRYIFIEPDTVLQALKAEQFLDELDEQRMVCISLDAWAEAIRDFKIKDYFYINAVQSFNAICAEDDHIQEYAEISWHITEVLSQLNWTNTIELGSEAFIARQIVNVADLVYPAKILEKAFLHNTVVLLAGGPSLDDILPWVRLHRREVVVFAVSRISRHLQQENIEPDFVFSVDPTELSFDVSKEMFNFSSRTTFVTSNHSVPTLVNQWPGHLLYLGARLPWQSALNVKNLSSVGPTVTNTALSVAYDFGFKRIILAGVDLCFTKEGFTHAKGSNEQLAGPRFNLTSLQVETNDGFLAPTSCDFAQAIVSLGVQAKTLAAKGCSLINVYAKAAKVKYIEYTPLDEIILASDQLQIEISELVAAKVAAYEHKGDYYQKTIAELKRARYQVGVVAKLAENARRINDEMYSPLGRIENYKDKRKLDQIEKVFKREYRQVSKLVKKFGIRRFIKLAKPFTDEEWTAEEAKQIGNVFYDAYQEGAAKLLELIDKTLDLATARQQELVDAPDFSLLIRQYRLDRSYGRVRLLRKKLMPAIIPVDVAVVLDELDDNFVNILNEKNTGHLANAKNQSSLIVLKQRAGLLFKHKKLDDLQNLQAGLEKHEQHIAAHPYRQLINAYLAELEDRSETALEFYQQIVENGDTLLEEALSRIAAISIDNDDLQTANISLQCLSQLNSLYLPLYAEMLCLQGDSLLAIDIYNNYIAQFPNDTLVQIKLAMLYAEHQVFDAAELMLDFILLQKPKLESVIAIKKQLNKIKADKNLVSG